ncbi:MAG: LysR family transcriptional regulator [Rhodobiaceae bacterium]|nr:LysR family transcriptional regulator [Rhodobiaceae bacterium]
MLINPTIRQLEAFVAVATEESFTRASAKLGLSQPALSQTIAQLESVIEVQLFERTTRVVRLTPVGAEFLPKISRLLDELNAAVRDARRLSRLEADTLRIACLASVSFRLLPRMIREFNRIHPSVQVVVHDAVTAEILRLLDTGQAEIAVTSTTDVEGFDFRPLMRDPYQLLCRRDHPLAERSEIAWAELLDHTLIAMTPDTAIRRTMNEAFARIGLSATPAYVVARLITVFGMVESGLGVAALPAFNCPQDDTGILVSRPLVDPVMDQTIGILTLSGRTPARAAAAFRDMTLDWVQTQDLGLPPLTGEASQTGR